MRLYFYFLRHNIQALLEYRANFIIGVFSSAVSHAASLVALWMILELAGEVGGWRLEELLFLYGVLTLSRSLPHMFADNLWSLGDQYVRTGDFDRFLVRPMNPLFHFLAHRFCPDGVGTFLVGLFLVARARLVWSPIEVCHLGLAVLTGAVIFGAAMTIASTSAFWLSSSFPLTLAVFNVHELARFPLTIYPRSMRLVLTWILPYGFASYYPAGAILGRDEGSIVWAGPAVAVVLAFVAYRFWLIGLARYGSAGS